MRKVIVYGALKLAVPFIVFLCVSMFVANHAHAEDNISDKNLRLDIGFTHWASDTFRKPQDGKDFSFGIGYRLPVHWLEVQGRYEWAHIKASPTTPNYAAVDGKRVDFLTAGIALVAYDFIRGDQRVILSYTLSALVVSVDGKSSGIGNAAGPKVEWLFDGRQGMIIDIRKQGYYFPSSITTDLQTDFSLEMGYVIRF